MVKNQQPNEKKEEVTCGVRFVVDDRRSIVITASDEGIAKVSADGAVTHFWRRVEVPFRIDGELPPTIPLSELIAELGYEVNTGVNALLRDRKDELEAWMLDRADIVPI